MEHDSSPTPTVSDALLGAYLAGECTPDECASVEAWLAEPEHYASAELVRAGWDASARPEIEGDLTAFVARLAERRTGVSSGMTAGTESQTSLPWMERTARRAVANRTVAKSSYRWIGALLAAVVVIVAGLLVARGRPGQFSGDVSATTYITYATRVGQTATIMLRDGTRVTLNVASTLRVPTDFSVNNRRVWLNGQAQFDVEHGERHPFVVEAQQTQTTVLGTTFGVRAYDRDVQVVVKSGKVAVAVCGAAMESCGDDRSRVTLAANDLVAVSPNGAARVQHDVDIDTDLAFASGQLVFTWVPLRDAIADLDRWYGVDIRVIDPAVDNQQLKGSLPPGTPSDLVRMLEVTLGARVVRNGRVVTVYQH